MTRCPRGRDSGPVRNGVAARALGPQAVGQGSGGREVEEHLDGNVVGQGIPQIDHGLRQVDGHGFLPYPPRGATKLSSRFVLAARPAGHDQRSSGDSPTWAGAMAAVPTRSTRGWRTKLAQVSGFR